MAVPAVLAGVLLALAPVSVDAQTLRGSPQAMQKQNRVALQHDYSFLNTSAEVRRFVDLGLLVRLSGNGDYQLAGVSHPYARPAVKLFVERLAGQYRAACGERLVVTSLTRPVREQPRNASQLSVHPAGMAVDLRISNRASCRNWLEKTLMSLEKQGLLDAIRERNPPHYHVALFPEPYTRYVTKLTGGATTVRVASNNAPARNVSAAAPASSDAEERAVVIAAALEDIAAGQAGPSYSNDNDDVLASYRVNRGDSLWSIARRHGTTVDTLKALNGLKSAQIRAGQVISVPSSASGADSE